MPEPWATRLILEGKGTVLVDERDLWTETSGEYVTTHLIARTEFLEEHPDLVRAIIEGLGGAIDAIAADPEQAQADVIAQIESITGQSPAPEVIATSFGNLTFTLDPIAASLAGSAADAEAVGLLEPVDLERDLRPVAVERARGGARRQSDRSTMTVTEQATAAAVVPHLPQGPAAGNGVGHDRRRRQSATEPANVLSSRSTGSR